MGQRQVVGERSGCSSHAPTPCPPPLIGASCRLSLIHTRIQACGRFGEEESESEGQRRESSKPAVKRRLEGKTRGQAFRVALPCSWVSAPDGPPTVTPQAPGLESPWQAGQNRVALP